MLTRSLLQIMVQLATWVDVPPAHVKDGRTIPGAADASVTKGLSARLFDIK